MSARNRNGRRPSRQVARQSPAESARVAAIFEVDPESFDLE